MEAIRVGDQEDLDQLTIRRLASQLGVGTMTLYSYFRSKDEILDSMADHVLGGMVVPPTDDNTAESTLQAVAQAFLDTMRTHPSVVRLLTTRVTTSPHSLDGAMETVLDRLVKSGIPGDMAVRCYGFLITYALGFASYQRPRPWGHSGVADSDELKRQRRHFYASLPSSTFPNVIELSSSLVGLPSDEQYYFGIDCFIASVMAQLQPRRARLNGAPPRRR